MKRGTKITQKDWFDGITSWGHLLWGTVKSLSLMQYIAWTIMCFMKDELYSEDYYKKLYNFQMSCPAVFSDATNWDPPGGKSQWH